MTTEIKKQENIKIEEIQALPDENMNIIEETYKKFNSIIYNNEELNKFKDNILSLLKERDKIYLDKLIEYKAKTEKIKIDFDLNNKLSNSKFSKIIDTQAQFSYRLDQLNNYETFVTKTNDKLISHEVRLTNIREDFSLATQKYDKIYLDNLELPGYIGRCAKYKNCQIFFLEVIKDLAKLNKYREKNIIDLKMYKEKLETIISSMNTILDNNNQSQIKYINETKDKILKDCNNMFESVCENMKEIRVENSKYAVDLITQSMDLGKKWDKIEKIKEDLLEKFNYSVNKYQMLTDDTIKSFEEFKTEYSIIRRKFMELAEFIKDVRFRKNIGENVKKKEIKGMVKKMLRKRKSFEGKDVHLLSDISNIENIDYKKYYHVETKNDDNNNENTDNRSISLKNKNERKNKNNEMPKNKKNYSVSKEAFYRRDLNQSAEETRPNRINIKNPLTSIINAKNNVDPSTQSINITPINLKNLKTNITNSNSSALVSNRNSNNKKENNIDIKFDIKSKNKENLKENDKNKISKEKTKTSNKNENLKEKNNEIISKDNLKIKSNLNINKEVKNNINNNNQNSNLKDDPIKYVQNNKIEKDLKIQENRQINENINIPIDNIIQENNVDINKCKESNKMKLVRGSDSIDKQNLETSNNSIKNNIVKNEDISLSNIQSYRTNLEIKPSILDDTSSNISDVYGLNSAKDIKNNNIIGLSSEKSLSFISDNNNNNINRFLINDMQIINNDKIIKELASELEQSTAKKDKLASNKKEIEQKFKNACNKIEPINLLVKKEDNLKIFQNENINVSNNNNIDNNTNLNKNIYNNEYQNKNNIIYNNEYQHKNNNIIKDLSNQTIINNNLECNQGINNNNELQIQNINNVEIMNNNTNINDLNDNENEVQPTKTTEEGNNNINNINNNNINEIENRSFTEEDKTKNIKYINKTINKSNNNLNPIKINNEFIANEQFNTNSFNKKLHQVDQKLLNLELYTKEKILDLISQINLIKNNYLFPINDSFVKEKSIIEASKTINLPSKTASNPKYKTFNNSFLNNSTINNQQNSFCIEKNKENISSNNINFNNENNKNIYNINNNSNSNPQYIFNNINIDKKRFSLKEINQKSSLLNQKLPKKGNLIALNYNGNINNNVNSNLNNSNNFNNIIQNNSLTENSNGFVRNTSRNGNIKEVIDGGNNNNINNNKIIQNLNEINNKFLKEVESKINNGNALKNYNNDDLLNKSSNKSLNHGSNRNSFAYSNSTFNGTEIKLVDLNKLVNHQLPRNRLIPIRINDNDYLVSLNSK